MWGKNTPLLWKAGLVTQALQQLLICPRVLKLRLALNKRLSACSKVESSGEEYQELCSHAQLVARCFCSGRGVWTAEKCKEHELLYVWAGFPLIFVLEWSLAKKEEGGGEEWGQGLAEIRSKIRRISEECTEWIRRAEIKPHGGVDSVDRG